MTTEGETSCARRAGHLGHQPHHDAALRDTFYQHNDDFYKYSDDFCLQIQNAPVARVLLSAYPRRGHQTPLGAPASPSAARPCPAAGLGTPGWGCPRCPRLGKVQVGETQDNEAAPISTVINGHPAKESWAGRVISFFSPLHLIFEISPCQLRGMPVPCIMHYIHSGSAEPPALLAGHLTRGAQGRPQQLRSAVGLKDAQRN